MVNEKTYVINTYLEWLSLAPWLGWDSGQRSLEHIREFASSVEQTPHTGPKYTFWLMRDFGGANQDDQIWKIPQQPINSAEVCEVYIQYTSSHMAGQSERGPTCQALFVSWRAER